MTPAAFDSHRLPYSNTHTSTFRFFKIPKSQNPNPKNIHPEPAFLGLSRCIIIIIIILFTHSKTRTTRAYRAPIGVAVRRRASDVGRRTSTLQHTHACFTSRRRVRASLRTPRARALDVRLDDRAPALDRTGPGDATQPYLQPIRVADVAVDTVARGDTR